MFRRANTQVTVRRRTAYPDTPNKRARGPEERGSNKQHRAAGPSPVTPLSIHTLTVNIDGLDTGKWEQITKMPVFPQLDSIILTELRKRWDEPRTVRSSTGRGNVPFNAVSTCS